MESMTDKILVFTTCGTAGEAQRIARALVDSRLAACVAITASMRSVYRWQGAIEESGEWSLAVKSRHDLFAPLSAEIRRLHSYQTPEIIALPVMEASPDYAQWMDDELLPPTRE